jgi:isoleucyl-tRNA synthetase
MLAPILPHLAEDMWLNLPIKTPSPSVFQGKYEKPNYPPHCSEDWVKLLKLRDDVNKCIELARRDKLVGSNTDCQVSIYSPDAEMTALLDKYLGDEDLRWPPSPASNGVDELKYILMVSQVKIVTTTEAVSSSSFSIDATNTETKCSIGVSHASGGKCARCWMYCETVHTDLCPRCSHAVIKWTQKNKK